VCISIILYLSCKSTTAGDFNAAIATFSARAGHGYNIYYIGTVAKLYYYNTTQTHVNEYRIIYICNGGGGGRVEFTILFFSTHTHTHIAVLTGPVQLK
jgi:hypothetical protein